MTQQQHILGSKLVSKPRTLALLPLLPLPLYLPQPALGTPRSGA